MTLREGAGATYFWRGDRTMSGKHGKEILRIKFESIQDSRGGGHSKRPEFSTSTSLEAFSVSSLLRDN